MFIPPTLKRCWAQPMHAHCYYCSGKFRRRDMFKIKQGPSEGFFCHEAHAVLWLQARDEEATWELCRSVPSQRTISIAEVACVRKLP